MKKILLFFCFILTSLTLINAKDANQSFRLIIPQNITTEKSLYNKIEFLDSRSNYESDKVSINKNAFNDQLQNLLYRLNDGPTENLTLFFQLRNLDIEKDKNKQEYIRLRATLYEKNEFDYYFIKTLETKIPLDKSDHFQELASIEIVKFISQNLNSLEITPDTKPYSIGEVEDIASSEKYEMKAYTTNILSDGVYSTFNDFINQKPAKNKIITKLKKGELKEVKVIGRDNKELKLKPDQSFAVIIDGQIYISTGKKYLPVYKYDNEFCFEDQISESNLGIAPAFSVGFGSGGYRNAGIGIGIFTQSNKRTAIFKIDHLTGDFILISYK